VLVVVFVFFVIPVVVIVIFVVVVIIDFVRERAPRLDDGDAGRHDALGDLKRLHRIEDGAVGRNLVGLVGGDSGGDAHVGSPIRLSSYRLPGACATGTIFVITVV